MYEFFLKRVMPVGSVHIQTAGTVLTLLYHYVIRKYSFIKAKCRKKKTKPSSHTDFILFVEQQWMC